LDINQNNNDHELSPYEILGVKKGANFEEIQKARDEKVKAAGDDLIAKAKIESSYDQLLMGSLKARQSGSISFEAQDASLKEIQNTKTINSQFPLLSKIKNLSKLSGNNSQNFSLPNLSSETYDQLPTRISLALIVFILLFITPDSYNRLLLSISTLILTFTQIRSGKRFIGALGWSVVFLSIGLIFGGLIETNSFIQEVSTNSFSVQKIQSLPALIILWLGIIFL
tara:strand:- start:4266 stop:4943 length:678 start_codon:yes stop_codon:yes gene_type:complete